MANSFEDQKIDPLRDERIIKEEGEDGIGRGGKVEAAGVEVKEAEVEVEGAEAGLGDAEAEMGGADVGIETEDGGRTMTWKLQSM